VSLGQSLIIAGWKYEREREREREREKRERDCEYEPISPRKLKKVFLDSVEL
jgi:hypothetical protein